MGDWNELWGKEHFCRIVWQCILTVQTTLNMVVYRTFLYNPTNLKVPKKHRIRQMNYHDSIHILCTLKRSIGYDKTVNSYYLPYFSTVHGMFNLAELYRRVSCVPCILYAYSTSWNIQFPWEVWVSGLTINSQFTTCIHSGIFIIGYIDALLHF